MLKKELIFAIITIGDCMKQIRIIPMSKSEEDFVGKDIEYIQKHFFCRTLIERQGWYLYKQKGIVAEEGELLLFQFDNSIIASAELIKSERFARVMDENRGSYWLKCSTIKIFDPISPIELRSIIPSFNAFNETKPFFYEYEVDLKKLENRMNQYNG